MSGDFETRLGAAEMEPSSPISGLSSVAPGRRPRRDGGGEVGLGDAWESALHRGDPFGADLIGRLGRI